MAKFKVLKLNENIMFRLRIYSHHLINPTNDFFKSITVYYFLFSLIACAISSAVFVYQNISELGNALRSSIIVVGIGQAIGMFMWFGLKIVSVKALHLKLQEIVDETDQGTHLYLMSYLTENGSQVISRCSWRTWCIEYVLDVWAKVSQIHENIDDLLCSQQSDTHYVRSYSCCLRYLCWKLWCVGYRLTDECCPPIWYTNHMGLGFAVDAPI